MSETNICETFFQAKFRRLLTIILYIFFTICIFYTAGGSKTQPVPLADKEEVILHPSSHSGYILFGR